MSSSSLQSDSDARQAQDAGDAAWSDSALDANPHEDDDKAERVRRMFAAIAPRYDLNNRLHSFGRDQAWRRAVVQEARIGPSDEVLDVACGTGDLARAFAAAGPARVVGLDYTAEMLDIARRKRHVGTRDITYVQGDAMDLPFEDGEISVVSIAFGIRNVADPARATREFLRVLKPGGRLLILEFRRPSWRPIAALHDLWTKVVMPRTATWISRDRSGAYRYLPRSVETFLDTEQMAQLLRDSGFTGVSVRSLTLGVCACYRAVKPRFA